MRNKHLPIIISLLLCCFFSYANTKPDKFKKEDPDMTGFVLEAETGKPIRDVNVTAYINSKKEKVVATTANGSFALMDLKPGIYKLIFEKEGFEKVVREKIIMKTNEGYQLNVQMSVDENIFDLVPSPLRFSGR